MFWKKYQSFAYFRKNPDKVTPSIQVILDQLQNKNTGGSSSSSAASSSQQPPQAPTASAAVDEEADDEDWSESDWQCWHAFKKLKAEGSPPSFLAMQEKLDKMNQQCQSFFASWQGAQENLKNANEGREAQMHIFNLQLQEKDKVFAEYKSAALGKEAQWEQTEAIHE